MSPRNYITCVIATSYVAMTCFNVIDSKTLMETVTHLKPSTCCLDTLPTNLFNNVFDCLAIDILQIVNNYQPIKSLKNCSY